MSFSEDFKHIFRRSDNGHVKLIVINLIVFVLCNLIDLVYPFSQLFSLAANKDVFISHFWGLFTYMFLHKDAMHILFNMLWLYWMGTIFIEFLGSRRLVVVYIIGGLCGGLLFLLLGNFLWTEGQLVLLMGASGSVMAVVVAVAALVPDYTIHLMFFGPVRLKYLALFSFVTTTLLDLNVNTGGKIAHMGGALFGLLYTLQYKRGFDMTNITKIFERRSKMKVAYKRKVSDEDYNLSKRELQRKVDEILDKISKSGYESLSKEEKEILFKASDKK